MKPMLLGVALLLASAAASEAKQLVVVGSTSPQYAVGQVLAGGQKLSLAAGNRLTIVGDDGKVIKLEGPFTGVIGEGGDAPKAGGGEVIAALSKLLKAEGPETAALGTFRGAAADDPAAGRRDPWAFDVQEGGSQCLPAATTPTLWRARAARELTISIEERSTRTGGLVRFAAGSDTAGWPVQVPLKDGATYAIREANESWSSLLTVRIIPAARADAVERAAWMAEIGCLRQARLLLASL